MQRFSLLISLIFFLFSISSNVARAQESVVVDQKPLLDSLGVKEKYATTIEMSKGYLSGISVIKRETHCYRGILFNEFGVTALEFTYDPYKKKIRFVQLIAMLNKWYIRRLLKKDLCYVMENLFRGISTYKNGKYHIIYQFSLMDNKPEVIGEDTHETEE